MANKSSVFVLLISFFLSATAQAKPSPLIYAVTIEDETTYIYINSRAHWDESGNLTDSYSEEEDALVDELTTQANLCNASESTYEPCRGTVTPAELMKKMGAYEALCLGYEQDFQEFMELEVSPGFSFNGVKYDSYTAVFKLVARLYGRLSTPLDLLGQRAFKEEDFKAMKELIYGDSFVDAEDRAVLATMANAHALSHTGEQPPLLANVPHLADREIQAHLEKVIAALCGNRKLTFKEAQRLRETPALGCLLTGSQRATKRPATIKAT